MSSKQGMGCVVLALLFAAAAAHAQEESPGVIREATSSPAPDTYETTRGLALGLGARASATSTSGVAYNAAGLGIGRHYHVESTTFYVPQAARFGFGAALIDSYSGPIHAGMSYRYIQGNGANGHSGMEGRLALSLPIGDAFALGMTGRYLSYWRDGDANAQQPWAEGFTFDASVRVSPLPGLHFAALGNNLLDMGSPLVPMQVGGSASYTVDNALTLAFDGLADLSTWRVNGNIKPEALFGGALEYFTGEVPIRIGYFFDTGRDVHTVSGGLGWMNREFGFDVSVRQQVNGPQQTTLLGAFRYFVH
jgi:hypothetical protein